MTIVKLLIVSDSHGDMEALHRAVYATRPDAVVHLGDHCADADELAGDFPGLPVLSVRGNCDYTDLTRSETLLRVFDGVRVFAAHGHRYGVKTGLLRFVYAAQEQEAQLALFGHTHSPHLSEEGGLWLLNPGACGGVRPTCAVVTIENGGFSCRLKEVYSEGAL